MKTTTFHGATILVLDPDELRAAVRAHIVAHAPSVLSGTSGAAGILDDDISFRSPPREVQLILHPLVETAQAPAGSEPPLSEASIAWCTPLRDSSELRSHHLRALMRARRIERSDFAIGFLPHLATHSDRGAARDRIFAAWRAAQEHDVVCSIHWKTYPVASDSRAPAATTAPWGRAVVVLHGSPPREIHGSSDSQDRRRACREAEQWALRNNLVVVRDSLAESDAVLEDDDHAPEARGLT